jgi:hypothetical protein
VVARKLRFESLELRRLFAIDLELQSANIVASTDPLYSLAAEESVVNANTATQLVTLTGTDIALVSPPPLVAGSFDKMGSPFLVEVADYLIVARPNYANRSTDLHILTRQADGTANEAATLNVDMHVERMFRLGDKVVLFGSQYHGGDVSELRFTSTISSRLLVVDPTSHAVVYEADLPGAIIQAIELPTGIAFETAPIYTLAQPAAIEPILASDSTSESTESEIEPNTTMATEIPVAVEPNYELSYLYMTEAGFGMSSEKIDGASTLAFFGESLITVSPMSTTASTSPQYALRRWDGSENQLREIDSIDLPSIESKWEYLQSFEISPNGSQLLVSRASQEWIEEKTWKQKLTLDWLQHGEDGTTLTGSYTVESFIGTARWINENQILLLSYDAPAEVAILDISNSTQPTMSKIALSQRLQLNHLLPLGDRHIALMGFTPVTPFPIDGENGDRPEVIPMVVTHPSHGAIVILDLQQLRVTDEQIFGPNTMLDQPLPVASLPNHFAFRSFTTNPDWSYTESIHVSTIDEQGMLVTVDELTLGSDWTYQQANGSTVTILSSNFIEERAWADLDQAIWRVNFEPQPQETFPVPGPVDPLVPKENMREELTEEMTSTGTVPADIPMDTNGDGIISPIDVLQVINYINRAYAEDNSEELLIISTDDMNRFDFDGDNKILPTDAMMMIASLNVIHATFESLEDVSVTPELPDEPCFWDMLTEEHELPDEMIAASIEALFDDLFESPETSFAGDFWNWFAPMDPWADRLKQQWIAIDPSLES